MMKRWMGANWFVVSIALVTTLTALSNAITNWLALGFGWVF